MVERPGSASAEDGGGGCGGLVVVLLVVLVEGAFVSPFAVDDFISLTHFFATACFVGEEDDIQNRLCFDVFRLVSVRCISPGS